MKNPQVLRGLLVPAFTWALVLSAMQLLYNLVDSPTVNSLDQPTRLLSIAVSGLGLFLPFCAFASGVAAYAAKTRAVVTLGAALTIALVSFVCLAYLGPLADYRHERLLGFDMEARSPFGPDTPAGLLQRLRYARANPPANPSLSVEAGLDLPAQWIERMLHTQFSWPLLAIVSALLGYLVASVTSGLSPPGRRHARWAFGVLSGLTYMVPAVVLTRNAIGYALDSVIVSGVRTAWLPHLLPTLIAGALWFVVRRADETAAGPSVSGGHG